jgi:hypothetical protein
MDNNRTCGKCEFETDMKGCALKHIQEARKMLIKQDYDGVERMLSSVEGHLREL